MLNYTQDDIKVDGVKIHYYRTGGKKPPFILLHGATDSGLCWTPVAELLAKDYDVIMPDAQGHGLSDRIDQNFTDLSHIHQVVELVRELGITKPIIMGHSMGTITASRVAANYPELPQAIILEDPVWFGLKLPPSEEDMKREQLLMAETAKRTREELINKCRHDHPTWSEAEIIPWAEAKRQFDPKLFSAVKIGQPPYTQIVPLIRCPLLVIISDGGIGTPESVELAEKLWQSKEPFRWVQIKDAGHNIRREQFKVFYEAVSNFLRTCVQ